MPTKLPQPPAPVQTDRDPAAERLAELLARGARHAGATEAEAAEMGARGARALEEAADRVVPSVASPALVGAVSARRGRAIELALERPTRPLPKVPAGPKTAQRERFEASYYARAPLFAPAQWVADDYALCAYLRRIGGRNVERRVMALPRELSIRVRRASLGIVRVVDEHGRSRWGAPRRSWSDATAQDVATVAITLYRHAGDTTRAGWSRVTEGISEGMLATLLVNRDDGEPMDRRTIERHVQALRRAGAFYSEQPPAGVAKTSTIGPSGHAINLYYWTDRACEALRAKPPGRSQDAPRRADAPGTLEPPPGALEPPERLS